MNRIFSFLKGKSSTDDLPFLTGQQVFDLMTSADIKSLSNVKISPCDESKGFSLTLGFGRKTTITFFVDAAWLEVGIMKRMSESHLMG